MLPRHLLPLALGFAAFVMAEAASDIAHDEARQHAVACINARIAVESRPQIETACRFESFAHLEAAQRFATQQFGGVGAPCGCD